MSSSSEARDGARTRAQSHFAAAEKRDATVFAEIAKERQALESKTAKLRAMRLAKEEEDRAEAARIEAEQPPAKAKPARKAATKRKAIRVS